MVRREGGNRRRRQDPQPPPRSLCPSPTDTTGDRLTSASQPMSSCCLRPAPAAQQVTILHIKKRSTLAKPHIFCRSRPQPFLLCSSKLPRCKASPPRALGSSTPQKNPSTCPAPTGHLCLVPGSGSVSPPQPHVAAPAQEGHSLARLLPFRWGLFSFFFAVPSSPPAQESLIHTALRGF